MLIFCAVGLSIYARHLRHTQTISAVAQAANLVFYDSSANGQAFLYESLLTLQAQTSPRPTPPLISLCWNSGILYDPITNKITLPNGVSVLSAEHNPAYYIHEITLDGANLPRLNRLFMVYSTLVINIEQDGDTLNIRTRHGAAMHLCPEGRYLQLVNLRDIYHTIVIIDPGHGGIDTGARNVLGRNAPNESAIVLAISQKVLDIFDEPGILLIPTRTTDIQVDNWARYRLANRVADYFISIHANACDRSRNSQGTLTLYGSAPGSAALAYALQSALVDTLGSQNRGTELSTDFRILNGANIPVALLELLFMSNPAEAERLGDPATQMLIAQTIADVISRLDSAR
ncbi:MAG: N-acetylmuramoyl-L-alanine amidase [Firmicutes bacterium]|nr:N-acetylmuramoyl-L-alanine amidase [Bacillota bacterium]